MSNDTNSESSTGDIILTTHTEVLNTEDETLSMLGGEDVSDLLLRLSTAHDVAQEVEQKLDVVLENLDKLLGVLDPDACLDEPTDSEHPNEVKNCVEDP